MAVGVVGGLPYTKFFRLIFIKHGKMTSTCKPYPKTKFYFRLRIFPRVNNKIVTIRVALIFLGSDIV